jgi:fatty acid desaturase
MVYGAFAGLTLAAGTLPLVIIIAGLALTIALHSSLQHEVLHGHPFRSQRLNDALVFPALGLFIPYLRFKDTHLQHHYDPNLTDPYDDPETNYLDVLEWQAIPGWQRHLAQANNTLAGRMLLGPLLGLGRFYAGDLRAMARGHRRVWLSYGLHLPSMALPLAWVLTATELPLWAYALAAYGAMALLKIRTYLEHQAHARAAARSVIIEDRGLLALLFLNNNYHAVHHAHPRVAWHKLPALFESRRDQFLARNEGYAYPSYRAIFAQYLLRSKDPVAHPLWSLSNRTNPKP